MFNYEENITSFYASYTMINVAWNDIRAHAVSVKGYQERYDKYIQIVVVKRN